jgi:hypothetical protein
VKGRGTKFLSVSKGSKLKISPTEELRVTNVIDDEKIEIENADK